MVAPTSSTSGSSERRWSTTPFRASGSTAALRHRVAQPEGLHGDEDRSAGRATRGRRLGPGRDPCARRRGIRPGLGARPSERRTSSPASWTRCCRSSSRRAASAPCGRRCGERHGWGDASPRPRANPAARRRPLLLRARRQLPEPRAQSVAAGEPRVHRREDREESADLGVAFDGDADRCFFVDDTGEFVPGDFVTALLAAAMLEKEPGERVIYDVRASWAVPEAIERRGGNTTRQPGGPRVHQAADAQGGCGLRGRGLGALLLPRLLAGRLGRGAVPRRAGDPLAHGSQAVRASEPFRSRFFLTGEINTPVADVPLKLQELKERYSAEGGGISHLDGISVDFDDWHFNVRPSNTEPLLRLNLEALSRESWSASATRCSR